MNKQLQKNIATSFTALAFFVIGISGVLMYFHLYKEYIEELHEIIGLFFVGVVFFHIFYNLKSMKQHLKSRVFWIGAILITTISLIFILNTKEGDNPKKVIIMSVLNTPISNSLKVFNRDRVSVESRLSAQGIIIEKNDSIQSIAKRHKMSPFHIVDIINTK